MNQRVLFVDDEPKVLEGWGHTDDLLATMNKLRPEITNRNVR